MLFFLAAPLHARAPPAPLPDPVAAYRQGMATATAAQIAGPLALVAGTAVVAAANQDAECDECVIAWPLGGLALMSGTQAVAAWGVNRARRGAESLGCDVHGHSPTWSWVLVPVAPAAWVVTWRALYVDGKAWSTCASPAALRLGLAVAPLPSRETPGFVVSGRF